MPPEDNPADDVEPTEDEWDEYEAQRTPTPDKYDAMAAKLAGELLAEAERQRPNNYAPWRECDIGFFAVPLAAALRAAVAEAREEAAKVAERIFDTGREGAHAGEQANRTAAAIRSLP